jgi:membrane associated rhomboid family serine protease
MFPISDDNPRQQTPYVTWTIIGLCVLVFLWQVSLGDEAGQVAVFQYGMIPARVFGEAELRPELATIPAWTTVLTSMFMHGGWMHLILNVLFLWIFGDNVEDRLGHVKFLIFYLLAGIAATLSQYAIAPESGVPNVGASGAIAGVLGAYILMFPQARVNVLLGRQIVAMPAFVVLGMWIVLQLVSGVGTIAYTDESAGGIAYMAHIGGFVSGLLMAFLLRDGESSGTAT